MLHKKLVRHFLPHFLVDPGSAAVLGHDRVHHRAHGLSLAALFGYLQILVVITVGLYLAKVHTPQILGTAKFSVQQIVELTNQRREENSLGPLVFNRQLSAAAAAKAADMFANDYWAHNSPAGRTPWFFIKEAGYDYVFAGENLARDFTDAGSVVSAWMKSSTHRANLLDGNFREIGVAVVEGSLGGREGTLVVQMFGAGLGNVVPTQAVSGEFDSTISVVKSKVVVGKTAATAMVGFIFALFALEAVVSLRRAHVWVKPAVWAHLGLLAVILAAVWYFEAGIVG